MKTAHVVIITFDNATSAIAGSHALQELYTCGDIKMHDIIMLRKREDGQFENLKVATDSDGNNSMWGMIWGGIIGVFLGPFGFLLALLTGTAIGAGIDLSQFNFDKKVIEDAKKDIAEGKISIIAQIDEPSHIFIDDVMNKFHAHIRRATITK